MHETRQALHLEVIGKGGAGKRLRISSVEPRMLDGFEGNSHAEGDLIALEGPLSPVNASIARQRLPWLKPTLVGLTTSFGVGDRLGLATPGHVRAFRKHGQGLRPVFAQQSAREMTRLQRSAQTVMDDVTFGLIEAEWRHAFGADADHLKTAGQVDECLRAGFTTFTLDPGDLVRPVTSDVKVRAGDIPWTELQDSESEFAARYSALIIQAADVKIEMSSEIAIRAAYKYGPAVAHAYSLYRHLRDTASHPIEVEVAVDETEQPTTLHEHVYLSTEMRRLGMDWVGLALRLVGSFEKGVEYAGDVDHLLLSLSRHSAISEALGPYKLSLHSASDKFSLYKAVLEATHGKLHVKTSGTSYLEALRVASGCAPRLFRDIYEVSQSAYTMARASYHVSADDSRLPAAMELADNDLAQLLHDPTARQVLHVGYGELIAPRDDSAGQTLLDDLRALLLRESERYAAALEHHIGRHLEPLRIPA